MILSLAIGGVAGEILVRSFLGDRMVLFPRYHSKAVYGDYTLRRLRPNTEFWHTSVDGRWKFVTNARGLRNSRDIAYEKPPGRLRVLAIGDSQTEGFEVRQEFTYSAVIERWLNARGVAADVINAGVSGYGTAEALAFLENEGVKYHPDVVVYSFYANDFDDNIRSGLYGFERGALVVKSTVYAPAVNILDPLNSFPPMRWLSEHSYLYSLAFNTIWDRFKSASIRRARDNPASAHEYATPLKGPTEYQISLTNALIGQMSRFCHSRGIQLVILDFPVKIGNRVGNFGSSIPSSQLGIFRKAADVLLLSEEILGPYRNVGDIHVAHGQNHVSEFTHLMFGVNAAQAIFNRRAGASQNADRALSLR